MAQALLKGVPGKVIMRITDGAQRYLFLRLRPHKPISRVLLFTGLNDSMAALEFIPGELHSETRGDLTQHFLRYSGMSYAEWNKFWFGTQSGFALEITSHAVIPQHLRYDVVDYWRLKQAPQNFVYVPCPSWALGRPQTATKPKVGELF